MAYYSNKYSIGLNSQGYVIAERGGKRYYQKKRAPTFVNKFGGGDSSYRDASFWQYFVQTNWRNGAKQLKFDDAGKFWKSANVDTTQLEEIKLSKSLISAGQISPGTNVETIASWRNSTQTLKADANLFAYYRFEGNANDSKGSNNGTATDVTYSAGAGKFSEGGSFNGTTSFISIPDQATFKPTSGAYSFAAWFNRQSADGSIFQSYSDSGGNASGIEVLVTSTGYTISHANAGVVASLSATGTPFTASTWQHIVVVYDGTTLKAYTNNTLNNSGAKANPAYGGTNYVEIGRRNNGGSQTQYFGGYIDDWAFFNRALTEAEVAIIYNNEIFADGVTSGSSVAYAGLSDGTIWTWDDATTWTQVFDARRITWFETGTDTTFFVGDDGGTEKATAQGFQVPVTTKMKAVSVFLKKLTGTPGNITVRIETNSTDKPSGTLVDAAATGTIAAFSSGTNAWYTVEFATNFSISASTVYWIVLKTAAAANDNNYAWAGKTASGYSGSTNANSTDGGGTWTAGTSDAYFRVLGNATSINCSLVTKVGSTKKILWGTGDPNGTENGDARIISFDGTNWALNKNFATSVESVVNSLTEFTGDTKVYVGVGPQARVYSSSDLSTYTLSKDIDTPDNPGYIYAMKEYNSFLYAGGGSPEQIPGQYYSGFLNYYDQTTWRILYPFDFTVVQSCEFYDAYLFLGTYHGQLYVYDTSSLNPLFSFKDQYEYQQTIQKMKYFDDKLYIGLYPQSGTSDTNAGVWVFERHGLYNAHTVSGVTGYRCFETVNGSLLVGTGNNGYVYKLSTTTYSTQGWYQSSYFDANLPSIDKLYKEVTIKHDALASGQTVVIYYRFKETDNWTTLGTSNTVGAIEKTVSFPTATYSKKITLKIELNTTTTTASPKVTEVVMKYTLYPERKWMWTMRLRAKKALQLFDRSTESRTATQIRANLEDLMSSQSLYAFVDVDGTSYTVLVNDIDQSSWVVNSDDVNEDEVVITLIEA